MIDRACISLNSRCNLKCKYCHFGTKKGEVTNYKDDLTTIEIEVLADNLVDYVRKNSITKFKLGIVGAGEPLLNFKQMKILVCKIGNSDVRDNFKLYTISNGLLITDEILDFFYEYKDLIELNISLDGYKEINDKYRFGFDIVFKNIKKYYNKFGYMPLLNAVVHRDSILNQETLLDFFISNGLYRVNFSKIFGDVKEEMLISDAEYSSFLDLAIKKGIIFRQNQKEEIRDCAKYGRLCGVGVTNIYIAKAGIYPCARFLLIEKYKLGEMTTSLFDVEKELRKITPCPAHECYFDYYKIGG